MSEQTPDMTPKERHLALIEKYTQWLDKEHDPREFMQHHLNGVVLGATSLLSELPLGSREYLLACQSLKTLADVRATYEATK